ncbi:MAG: medium chain dehydrogenase/reductase family protein [Candidatus Parvarchaeota archaeon]
MRQVVLTRHGRPDVLQVRQSPEPKPAAGEALVSVKASGLGFADIMARQGLYPDAPKTPCVLGYEISGTVKAVGDGVDEKMVGRPVLALTHFGGYSELVSVPAVQLFEKPLSLSYEEAAAIPVNYLTAYGLLVVMGSLKKEESVLIHNAGGGMGLAALDIAKHIGATTYGTASPSKHALLKQRGLDFPIDYRGSDWFPTLMKLTDGQGVELVIDPIGGSNWKKSYNALRATGRLGVFGLSAVSAQGTNGKLRAISALLRQPSFRPYTLFNSNKGVFGLNMGRMWNEREKVKGWMSAILSGVKEGWVRPHVDKAFKFEQAPDAHAYVEARKNFGKVVLVP